MAEETRKFIEIHRVVVYDWMAGRLKLKDTQIYVYAAFHTAGSHGIPSVLAITDSVSAILGIGRSTFYRVRDELCDMKLLGFTESPMGRVYYTREYLPEGGVIRERKPAALDEGPETKASSAEEIPSSPCSSKISLNRERPPETEALEATPDERLPDGDPMEALDGAVRLLEGGIRGLKEAGERMCAKVEKTAEEGRETRRRLKALSGKTENKKHGKKHGGGT